MAALSTCVLITGGAGFVGSALVRQWLASEPSAIVNLDNLTYAGLPASLGDALEHPRHTLVEGDVADAALIGELLAAYRPQAVLHLAAESHVDRSIAEPPQFVRTNVLGTCTLLDQATRYWQTLNATDKQAFRFLLVSTDEVFGSAPSGEKFSVDSPLAPNSPYAATKAAAEHLAHAFMHTYGLPVVTINPTNNYGPRQLPEKLIPRMILAAARRQSLPLYGDGQHERDWLHVDDCCRAIRTVLKRGESGRRYLVGAGAGRTNRRIVEMVCDLVDERLRDGAGRRELISHVADRLGHDRRYAVDASNTRQLGWEPEVNLEQGLSETVAWYLGNPVWVAEAEASLQSSKVSD